MSAPNTKRALGIDPGTARLGYGIVEMEEGGRLLCVTYGCITTTAKTREDARLLHIFQEMQKVIRAHRPDIIAMEDIFYFKNQKTIVQVSQARGVLFLCAAQQNIPVFTYTPPQIKQAVTGYGRAEKNQVQKMVQRLLGLKELPRPDDAADGLAAAICCLHSSGALSQLKQQLNGQS